ncbi:molybdopterin synthase sulfur carrier subunit [Frankia sp. CcI49]|uniref:MoaD/ThiS family protein n=1 Tax=Frankia sp. CcI49 TaxID=1745382 RepID=UPI0009769A90|nr:MoaD/ThiS family protein [Frankia sp. CcI49]ONH56915.1 molybdopterin synthase sulfur carrier subunit [Frankia sp. CcI49]
MAVQVRVPTILRNYTGGAKLVEGTGDTLAALFLDLESRHPGLRGRLIASEGEGDGEAQLHRFVNIYVNDEDVRFLGSLDAKISDGDNVTILPAVAGGSGASVASVASVVVCGSTGTAVGMRLL